MGEASKKALSDLIRGRDTLRKKEKEMTAKIKQLRNDIAKQKQSQKGNVQTQPLLRETREKLRALRLSCRRALKEAGYGNAKISEIMNVSYSVFVEHERNIIRKAKWLERKGEK